MFPTGIYWLAENDGGVPEGSGGMGGFFFRCDIKDHLKKMWKAGYHVVGINITDSYNIEFIVECDVDDPTKPLKYNEVEDNAKGG